VEDALSDSLLSGEFVDGDHILVDLTPDGDIILSRAEAPAPTPTPEETAPEPSA
jgi:hypothetical protein